MSLGHKISVGFQNLVSSIKPTLKESKFYAEGKLTPEEYISAGDFLTQKCPTWKWCAAKEGYYNSALPKDKQYLMTTVPCSKRADEYYSQNQTHEKELEGDWIAADLDSKFTSKQSNEKKIIDLDSEDKKPQIIAPVRGNDDDDDDIEIEPTEEELKQKEKAKEVDDFLIIEDSNNVNVVKTRIYDVTVTYDLYYCVPRMWLMGYSEEGTPLTDNEMIQDIMMEYRNKTVTIEGHPCTGVRNISVHPCKHSKLLKKMIENFEQSGKKLEVYMSILIFLKFLNSVVPTIQYDFTMDINF